jgi:hypothetical protein
VSLDLPAWLPDREALSALSADQVRFLDDQWQLAGGADTAWVLVDPAATGLDGLRARYEALRAKLERLLAVAQGRDLTTAELRLVVAVGEQAEDVFRQIEAAVSVEARVAAVKAAVR